MPPSRTPPPNSSQLLVRSVRAKTKHNNKKSENKNERGRVKGYMYIQVLLAQNQKKPRSVFDKREAKRVVLGNARQKGRNIKRKVDRRTMVGTEVRQ